MTTYRDDIGRTGANLTETVLTPANVNSSSFGLLRTLSVDGQVDAQPLYLSQLAIAGGTHDIVFVATEHDSVYAFDPTTGAALWHVSLLGSGEAPSDDRGCGQITPEIGVTSTPVIDRSAGPHGAIFLVAMSKDASANYHQ
ncbi:MAG: pyrrolo-quinoline quinone, partial [Steroidobacteraceae bacterium]